MRTRIVTWVSHHANRCVHKLSLSVWVIFTLWITQMDKAWCGGDIGIRQTLGTIFAKIQLYHGVSVLASSRIEMSLVVAVGSGCASS